MAEGYATTAANVCPACGETDYGDGPRWARARCDLRLWLRQRAPWGRSGSWSRDGLRWWFLFDGRLRIGVVDHRRWLRSLAAEGMTPWPCGDGYRFVHVGPYCFRWRGRPSRPSPSDGTSLPSPPSATGSYQASDQGSEK